MSTQRALTERQAVSADGVSGWIIAAPAHRTASQTAERLVSLFSPILLLLFWEALVRLGFLNANFFPAPTGVVGTLWGLLSSGELFRHVGISLQRSLIGFVLGSLPGLVLGLSMGLFPLARAAIWPMIGALYPIPKIAILPLVMLIFGLEESSKWVIIAIGVFFPMLINSMAGVLAIEKVYHDVGRNFGANRLTRFLTIALPGALPLVLTGVRLAWGVALLLVVAAEFVAAKSGLGYFIWHSWQIFSVEEMYVGIITISVIGYLSFLLLDELGRLLVPWKPGGVS